MITREDLIEQSAMDFVREALTTRGYAIGSEVVILESFPFTAFEPAENTEYISGGFNFDDEGVSGEMGSNLTRRLHTIQYFVFGSTQTYARNIANVIKYSVDVDARIPLRDYSDLAKPVIDQLIVVGVSSERQIIPNPEPFQENVFTATLRIEDEYYSS